MIKGLRVPTHTVDKPGVFIFAHDPAWDHDRIREERDELARLAEAEARELARDTMLRQRQLEGYTGAELTADDMATADASVVLTEDELEAARDRHPWSRYIDGAGRFDLDAEDQGPRGRAVPRSYLLPTADPTYIYLRRIPWQVKTGISIDQDPVNRWARYVRAGVEKIADASGTLWAASKKTPQLPDELLEALSNADGGTFNLIALAGACSKYSGPLTDAEGKR